MQPDSLAERIDLPSPSGWPIVVALGLTLAAGGMLVGLPVMLVGTAVLVVGVFRWVFQPLERPGHPVFGPSDAQGA